MRRSFKDHIRGFCNLRQYDWTESEEDGRWVLRIDHFIKIYNTDRKSNTYVLIDNIKDIRCTCKASAWDIMESVIEELMTEHLKSRQKQYIFIVS